eukprot:8420680-Pyramimonas_sp.AAC.1
MMAMPTAEETDVSLEAPSDAPLMLPTVSGPPMLRSAEIEGFNRESSADAAAFDSTNECEALSPMHASSGMSRHTCIL